MTGNTRKSFPEEETVKGITKRLVKNCTARDSPGGPVGEIAFQGKGAGSIPGWGAETPRDS